MKKIIPIALLCLFVFSECKKGEDDPLISLHTRKARVEGNWKMTKGKKSQTVFGTTTSTDYSEDRFLSQNSINGVVFNTSIGESSFTLAFLKNGNMNINRKLDANDSYTSSGTWNFTGGVGKVKNKEQIIFHDEQDPYNTDIVYFIKELRDEKMVLFRSGQTYSEEFTFEK